MGEIIFQSFLSHVSNLYTQCTPPSILQGILRISLFNLCLTFVGREQKQAIDQFTAKQVNQFRPWAARADRLPAPAQCWQIATH